MKKAIQLGAGNIGRGFIGALLAQAGYETVFADVNATIIGKLNTDRRYTVHVMDTECEDLVIENVRGVDSTTPAAVEEIASADLVTTAVGPAILPRIAPTIALAIEARRLQANTAPLNIIACENAVRATSQLKEAVYGSLSSAAAIFADAYIGFADCAVDRIVPPVTSENPLDVVVERYFEWDVERGGFVGEPPAIAGMTLVDSLPAYVERKLFTLNTGHAIAAYLGLLRGHRTIADAIADRDVCKIVQQAMQESGEALIRKYSFEPQLHQAYIQKILTRFTNPHLHDDVTRVGREPLRKLSAGDRLIKPMLTAHEYGLPVKHLIVGIAAALCCENGGDAQSVELQRRIEADGVRQTVTAVTGIEDTRLLERIEMMYRALRLQMTIGSVDLMTLVA